ncbi:histone H3-K56 acetyltransferase [Aphelenchoides avenae]|nr:histone H3-K56 acetyltransferase [Aphelenchus avenae]
MDIDYDSIDEMQQELQPILDALWTDASSTWYREPRKDGRTQGRNGTIEHPICLQDIAQKLNAGEYRRLEDFRDDFFQIVFNAHRFYLSSSNQFKQADALKELFVREASAVFHRHGYCCAEKHVVPPTPVVCSQCKEVVRWGGVYYRPENAEHVPCEDGNSICNACFTAKAGPFQVLDALQKYDGVLCTLAEDEFLECAHNEEVPEPTVACSECGRESHRACVGYTELFPDSVFVCKQCGGGKVPIDVNMMANTIPESKLSRYIEAMIDEFVSERATSLGLTQKPRRVLIRVVSSNRKTFRRAAKMAEKYGPAEYPYNQRSIYAFQETEDGGDVCFFGIRTQEYGNDSPPSNRGHIYLAYVDSVKVYAPSTLRTELFHRIILAYMEWMRQCGYVRLCLWACPPYHGQQYLFPTRATNQKLPNLKGLLKWYNDMFTTGQEIKVVERNTSAYSAMLTTIKTAEDVPCFFEDEIPKCLEEVVAKELNGKKCAVSRAKRTSLSPSSSDSTTSANSSQSQPSSSSKKDPYAELHRADIDPIGKAFLKSIRSRKEFIVVDMRPEDCIQKTTNGTAKVRSDLDPTVVCPFMEPRGGFIERAEQLGLRFSTLRLAKLSSLYMAFWINTCRRELSAHCQDCQALCEKAKQLCDGCARKRLNAATPNPPSKATVARKVAQHSFACQRDDCKVPRCRRNKQDFRHWRKQAVRKGKRLCEPSCTTCATMLAAVELHKKDCSDFDCEIPGCRRQLRVLAGSILDLPSPGGSSDSRDSFGNTINTPSVSDASTASENSWDGYDSDVSAELGLGLPAGVLKTEFIHPSKRALDASEPMTVLKKARSASTKH